MKFLYLFFLLPISIFSQEFDFVESLQGEGDSIYWKNPSMLDGYNDWDNLKTHWLGINYSMLEDTYRPYLIGINYVAPRGFSLHFSEIESSPYDLKSINPSSLNTFRANELIADRAGINYNSAEFHSSYSFSTSFAAHILINNLNFRLFPVPKRKRNRIDRNDNLYRVDSPMGNKVRRRARGKLFSLSFGFKYLRNISYNLYSDNGLSTDHLTPDGLLFADYSETLTLNPLFGFVFHPKYFFIHTYYDYSLNSLIPRIGVALPIKWKK